MSPVSCLLSYVSCLIARRLPEPRVRLCLPLLLPRAATLFFCVCLCLLLPPVQLWGSQPMFVPRILNLAKVKHELLQPQPTTHDARRGRRDSEAAGAAVARWRVWSADMHVGPIGDLKQVPAAHAARLLTVG